MENLIKALVEAQKDLRNVHTDSVNPHFKNKYASLSAVIDATREPLSKHGLVITQSTEIREDNTVLVNTTVWHTSGEKIESRYPVVPSNNTPQGYGSGLSYARRYSLLSLLNLGTDDDDANAASFQQRTVRPPPTERQPTTAMEHVSKPSEAQLKRLYAISKQANWSEQDVKEYLKTIGKSSSKELNILQYERLCELMQQFPKEQSA